MGQFNVSEKGPLSDRIYGIRIPVSWEDAVRGLPNQAEYIRVALEKQLIEDGFIIKPPPKKEDGQWLRCDDFADVES